MEYILNNQQTTENAFLGKGWAFPPAFSATTGTAEMVAYETDIWQSLQILFSTSVTERVMQPEYGCTRKIMYSLPSNVSFITALEDMITKSVAINEPRIKLEKLSISPGDLPNILEIDIHYIVRSTNTRFNRVYPFYKQEGTNVEP